jgi:hypothetical protein
MRRVALLALASVLISGCGGSATRTSSRPMLEADHPFREVDLAWYDQGRLKITIARGTPGVIRQAYLTGRT